MSSDSLAHVTEEGIVVTTDDLRDGLVLLCSTFLDLLWISLGPQKRVFGDYLGDF